MKYFISPENLRYDSYVLAAKVVDDGFIPDFLVALWRGGTPIGCCIHEYFKYLNYSVDHISIRTSRYTGVDQATDYVAVHNLGYLSQRVKKTSTILIVDDVFDSGRSIEAVLEAFKERFGENYPNDIRIATVYYKPQRNKSILKPNYYIHETNQWIVFPHELEEMTLEEISINRGVKIAELIDKHLLLRNSLI